VSIYRNGAPASGTISSMSVNQVTIRGGQIEVLRLPGGPGVPLLVLGGVETGLRRLAGTESLLSRRWAPRARRRPVVIMGRPIPATDEETQRLMHPRVIADAVATAIGWVTDNGGPEPPYAIEAESGGGRIGLWLAVDHPELVDRLVLSSVASETPSGSAMSRRMAQWIDLAENDDWGMFFGHMAVQMRPSDGAGEARSFDAAARLQPRPATPERFVGELRATLDPSSFVTDRLREVHVPALVLAGGRDQVVPPDATRQVADSLPLAQFELDADCGHTVRTGFEGYDRLVEDFLAKGGSVRTDAG
jgi:pimeloyl-ACP methyl ester carboxylesterase